MNWVDHPAYIGPDRRRRAHGLRLLDRRRRSALTDPPTLAAALRRLKLMVLDLDKPEPIARFAQLSAAYSQLCAAKGRPDIAGVLRELAVQIDGDREISVDLRIVAQVALAVCEDLIVQRAPRKRDDELANQRR